MNLIAHRINTREALEKLDPQFGAEVDIRSQGDRLIIHHDPFDAGICFVDWLDAYRHGTLILNVKEEGLETRLIALMAEREISDYFFLDQSFPFLVRTAERGEARCAVRVSEFESIDTAMSLAGNIKWVWVDCFTKFPLTRANADRLTGAGFHLCFVSPELQARTDRDHVAAFRNDIEALDMDLEGAAVCTKYLDIWA